MKTDKNILIAFILNLAFSVFEFVGGLITGSVAIVSDAVHDLGDAASIGVAYFLEKKSKRQPDEKYTYGYARYSVLGSAVTTLILLLGSVMVAYHGVERMIHPTEINYNGMIAVAMIGVCVNLGAALVTRGGGSLNQKAVNLHMLEDVLGWVVVLVGAVVMRLTDITILDSILSIGVAAFIFWNALKNLQGVIDLFLEKTPCVIDVGEIQAHLSRIEGVLEVHHIHVWSMDGRSNYATMHIVTNAEATQMKEAIRQELLEHGIGHVTLELEREGEACHAKHCHVEHKADSGHHHHHHH